MKKALSMILAAALMVSLAGCGGKQNTQEDTTKAQTEAQTEATIESLAETISAQAESDESSEPLKVGLSFVSLNFPYFVRMYEQFMKEADEQGWEVSFVDGNLDAATQLNGVQDMINNEVDVMVISTWYIDAMEDVFAQCKDKGIPVFNIGLTDSSQTTINELLTYVCGTEHYDAGFLGGTWGAKYFGDLGKTELKIVIMVGSTEQMKERGQGFVDGLTQGGIKVEVLNEYDVSTREDAMASAEDALTVYSDLDLIYGVSAQGSLGAYDATVGANRTEVMVVGYDGEEEELQLVDKDTNYIATITQDPEGEASTTIEYILKYLDGEKFEMKVPIPAGIYCGEGQLTSEQILGK